MEHAAQTAEAERGTVPASSEKTSSPPDEEWPRGEGGRTGRENR